MINEPTLSRTLVTMPKTPNDKITRYLLFCVCRNEGYSEAQLAARFETDSAEELYNVLNSEGFPVCVGCGHYSANDRYCEDCPPRRRRLPRGSEDAALELPSAGEAVELFKNTIEHLARAVDELPFIRQWLKDRRFVTESVHSEESGRSNMLLRKRDFDLPPRALEAHWKKLCKWYGQNPVIDEFTVPIPLVRSGGADWYPHDLLVQLVTAYAVTGKPLEDLMWVLHPDANQDELRKAKAKLVELLLRARQLTGILRGSPEATKSGRKAESITPIEQDHARNLTDEEFREEYKEMGMSESEMRRLTKLRLPHADPESE
jgi:hypothetical protein